MQEIPISIHEHVIAELMPTKARICDALCVQIPLAGNQDIQDFSEWLCTFGAAVEAVAKATNAMGKALQRWDDRHDTRRVLSRAGRLSKAIEELIDLRAEVFDAEIEARSLLLAMVDRLLRDILDWLVCYEGALSHPQASQGGRMDLTLDAGEELALLHRFMERYDGMHSQALKHKRDNMLSLFAAFGLGLWLGNDE